MKRLITSVALLLIYTSAVIGMPLHYHYCKGELQHISFFTQKECDSHEMKSTSPFACCMKDHMQQCDSTKGLQKSDCCSDQSKWLQIEQVALAENVKFIDMATVLLKEPLDSGQTISFREKEMNLGDRGPPGPVVARYIFNCSLVFYG